MRERCNPQCITVRKDIFDELGFKVEDIKTLDDITAVFAAVKEAHPEMVVFSGSSTDGVGHNGDMAGNCDPLNDKLGVLDHWGEEDLKVVSWYDTEYWNNLIKYDRMWYEAGYISKDMPTNTDSGATLFAAGNLFSYSENWKPNTRAEKASQYGFDVEVLSYSEPVRTTTSTSGLGYAVSGVTKYPDRAVELLDWLFGSAEVNDLMNFGVEGEDWVAVSDKIADYPEGKDINSVGYHLDWGWAIPNQFAGHLWTGNDEDLYEQYQEFRNNAHGSKAYGFSFDSTRVVDEVIACQAVVDEWLPQISTGSVDPEIAVPQFKEALDAAGLQTVIAEKQRQLDEWAAANGVN
jgi:putative aldouronate transport system substrate-binding protein